MKTELLENPFDSMTGCISIEKIHGPWNVFLERFR